MRASTKSHVVPELRRAGSGVGAAACTRVRTHVHTCTGRSSRHDTRRRGARARAHTNTRSLLFSPRAIGGLLSFFLSFFGARLPPMQTSQPRSASAVLAPSIRQHARTLPLPSTSWRENITSVRRIRKARQAAGARSSDGPDPIPNRGWQSPESEDGILH